MTKDNIRGILGLWVFILTIFSISWWAIDLGNIPNLQVGNKYLYYKGYDDHDPFNISNDTIIILDVKGQWVKWKHTNSNIISSNREYILRPHVRSLNYQSLNCTYENN